MSKLSAFQIEEIERRTASGESGRVIARSMGINPATVAHRVVEWRLRTGTPYVRRAIHGSRAMSAEHRFAIERLIDNGLTNKTIAHKTGYSVSAVGRAAVAYLHRLGIRRPKSPRYAEGTLSEAQRVEIERRVVERESYRDIAAALCISKYSVGNYAADWRRRTDATFGRTDIPEIISHVASGLSLAQTAERMGISSSVVWYYVRAHRRTHGQDSLPETPAGKGCLSKRRIGELEAMAEQGISAGAIAKMFGLSGNAVRLRIGRKREELRAQGVKCNCGRPIGHHGPCALPAEEQCRRARDRRQHREEARRRERLFVSSGALAARDAVFAEIARKVPRWMRQADRDDTIGDAYLAMLEDAI